MASEKTFRLKNPHAAESGRICLAPMSFSEFPFSPAKAGLRFFLPFAGEAKEKGARSASPSRDRSDGRAVSAAAGATPVPGLGKSRTVTAPRPALLVRAALPLLAALLAFAPPLAAQTRILDFEFPASLFQNFFALDPVCPSVADGVIEGMLELELVSREGATNEFRVLKLREISFVPRGMNVRTCALSESNPFVPVASNDQFEAGGGG